MTRRCDASETLYCNTEAMSDRENGSKLRVVRDTAPEPKKVSKAADAAIRKGEERIAAIVRDVASSSS